MRNWFVTISPKRIEYFITVATLLIVATPIWAIDISIGSPQIIYTKSQRKAGGTAWPDGSFGVVSRGNDEYDFYAANKSTSTLTTGPLSNPAAGKRSVSITGVPRGTFSYLAGGPVYVDPYSGARLMIYHAEKGGTGNSFYSMLGMAVSTDPNGQVFRDLGVIIQPNRIGGQAEVGGGSFAVVNGFLNVYYSDFLSDGTWASVAVARAPMAELLANALVGKSTSFNKYYNGDWSEPGIHGMASSLEVGAPANVWLGMSYNDYLDRLVMVSAQWAPSGVDLYLSSSADGINWSPRQPVALDSGEQYYPTIIGTGADPLRSGQSFYVYYTDSQKGAFSRWSDAQLRRREITINEPGLAANTSLGGGSLGYTADWAPVGNYQADFQAGAPATGWRYAWNPKGKVGASSALVGLRSRFVRTQKDIVAASSSFVGLQWSDAAQAYNTTGGATPTPNPKSHPDDFLTLTSIGGHPGSSTYMPMAGYTIQSDDGDGYYRIADSSIQLAKGQIAAADDSLQVWIYVNDTKIGTPTAVPKNGLLANFDRLLGALHVGDTVWVMIDALKNNNNDAFTNFNFSLEKLVYSAQQLVMSSELAQATVPEPGTVAFLLLLLALPRRR
jgi:hypothetical protein